MSSVWDDLEAFANTEERIGKKTFVVTEKKSGESQYGKWYSFKGTLAEAPGSRASMMLNNRPTDEDAARAKAEGNKSMAKGILYSKLKHDALDKYGKTVETLDVGDEIKVETKFEERDGKKFVVVDRILAPSDVAEVKPAASGKPPF